MFEAKVKLYDEDNVEVTMRHKTKYGSGHTYKGTTSVTAAQRQAKLNSLLAMLKRQGLTVVVDYQTDDEGPIALITAI